MFHFQINSDEGYIALGPCTITWANSLDPFFDAERLEGFCSFGFDRLSLEFGAIDQERPGLYLTSYKDGDIESTKTFFTI